MTGLLNIPEISITSNVNHITKHVTFSIRKCGIGQVGSSFSIILHFSSVVFLTKLSTEFICVMNGGKGVLYFIAD